MVKFQRTFASIIFLVVSLIVGLLEIGNTDAATISYKREFSIGLGLPSLSLFPTLSPPPPLPKRLLATTPAPTPPPLPEREEEVTITAVPDYAPTQTTMMTTTTTTAAAPVTVNSVQEDWAQKILDKLDMIDQKVNQVQDDLKKAQTSLAKQDQAIEEVRSKAEEYWLNLAAQIEDGFTNLSKQTTPWTTVEPFDVDIRSRSFLFKFPLPGGLTKNGTQSDTFSFPSSLPSSLPSSVSSFSEKLPQIPSLLNPQSVADGNATDNEPEASSTASTSPTDDDESNNDTRNDENEEADIQNL